MATQNKRKLLGLRFYEPKSKQEGNDKKHRRNSHITCEQLRKSRKRAKYNSMFYGF